MEAEPDAVPADSAGDVPARVPVEITVEIIEATAVSPALPRQASPTPTQHVGVAGMRVQVVTVFGDVLLDAVTPADGRVSFVRDVPSEIALYVQIPALGLRAQLPADEVAAGKTHVTIAVPPSR